MAEILDEESPTSSLAGSKGAWLDSKKETAWDAEYFGRTIVKLGIVPCLMQPRVRRIPGVRHFGVVALGKAPAVGKHRSGMLTADPGSTEVARMTAITSRPP